MITKSKWDSLKKLMNSLEIREENIIENFIRGSGKGGQKLNKTSTCVQLIYNNFEIKCQKLDHNQIIDFGQEENFAKKYWI